MSEAVPARGLVVAHGALAEGLLDAVRQVTGVGEEVLVGLSNAGCSPETLSARISDVLGQGRWVVFIDMQAGSCAFTARRLCREREDTLIVTGVNLPMLLDFVMNRELPLTDLADRLVDRGKQAVVVTDPPPRRDADRSVSGG